MAYPRRTSLGSLTAEGATVGTVIAGPLGTAAGGLIGSLFGGGKTYPTQTLTVNTPGGPVQIVFSGAGPVQGSAQYIFTQWAAAGEFSVLAAIANTGTGPKWDNPSQTYSGYGSTDRAFAAQLVQAYQRATDPTTGAPLAPKTLTTYTTAPLPAQVPQQAAVAGGGVLPYLLGLGLVGGLAYAAFIRPGGRRRYGRNPGRRRTHRHRSHTRRRR